jgi:hypothetical protein
MRIAGSIIDAVGVRGQRCPATVASHAYSRAFPTRTDAFLRSEGVATETGTQLSWVSISRRSSSMLRQGTTRSAP